MGAYNTVTLDQVCPSCHNRVEVRIQFKYGDTWQYSYQLGDRLTWGGNSIGEPGAKQVVADGAVEGTCPVCKYEWPDYEVWIEDDRIVDVRPASGLHDFVTIQESYIVLQP
jgi:hypothetical protein